MNRSIIIILLAIHCASQATPSYHTVGWTNFFIPGGGQYLQNEYWKGSEQALLEISTFGLGYMISARSPMTLDGVPEDLPSLTTITIPGQTSKIPCAVTNPQTHQCLRYIVIGGSPSSSLVDGSQHDLSRPLLADLLQEIGIKAHFVNLYDSYRQVAKAQGVDFDSAYIDSTPTKDLFLAPFKKEILFDPWVYIPLAVTAGVLFFSYQSIRMAGDYPAVARLNSTSKMLYDTTYLGVFPFGSGAPEEMFYRGFLQSELMMASNSPWVAVPVSTALYAFSHSSADILPAAATGLFLGYLAYRNHGRLKKGIAYHFWSDVMTGFYSIALLALSESSIPTSTASATAFRLSFDF